VPLQKKSSFGVAQKVWDWHKKEYEFSVWSKKMFGPAQNSLGPVEGRGISVSPFNIFFHLQIIPVCSAQHALSKSVL
jgi:hypothetical protein